MVLRKVLLCSLVLAASLTMVACTASLPQGDSGWVIMSPFTSEEFGIRGVEPVGMPDNMVLLQQSAPGTIDDLAPVLLTQTDLEQVPEPSGSYTGDTFTWTLYSFEAQIFEAGPETYHLDMALAEGDSTVYSVILIALPDDYEANESLFQTAFTHALYALAPLE